MSVFGWSYPPGAANDPNAPYNQNDDGDSLCAWCKGKLKNNPKVGTLAYNGYCSKKCKKKFKDWDDRQGSCL